MYMLVSIACMYCFCFVLCRCLYVCLYVSLYAGCEGAGSFAGARCSLAVTLFSEAVSGYGPYASRPEWPYWL